MCFFVSNLFHITDSMLWLRLVAPSVRKDRTSLYLPSRPVGVVRGPSMASAVCVCAATNDSVVSGQLLRPESRCYRKLPSPGLLTRTKGNTLVSGGNQPPFLYWGC